MSCRSRPAGNVGMAGWQVICNWEPIQTVRAHVSLPQRSSATILDRAGNARQRHCPSSPAVGVIYRSRRARYTSINKRRSGVCCCWPESIEQFTSCCPLLCHIQHFQKDLKFHVFGLSFSLWQLCVLTMYSTLVVIYTVYCALQIVRLIYYIT